MLSQLCKIFLTAAVTFGLFQSLGQAQSESKRNRSEMGKTVSVTGCLTKGDEANEFSITGSDGKKYGLRSATVNLADHLNHQVTVTGKTVPEHEEKTEGEKKENGENEYGHLNVANLKMVSSSCQ